jgi:hypothetical protein
LTGIGRVNTVSTETESDGRLRLRIGTSNERPIVPTVSEDVLMDALKNPEKGVICNAGLASDPDGSVGRQWTTGREHFSTG